MTTLFSELLEEYSWTIRSHQFDLFIYLSISYILLLFTLLFTKAFTQRMTDLLKEKEDQFVLIHYFPLNQKQSASFILFL